MILEWILINACLGQAQYREACKKSTEAATKQSGVYSFLDQVEKETDRRARIQIQNYGLENILAVGLAADKVRRDKAIEYNIKGVPGIDDVGVNAGLKGGSLGLHWSLD